MLNYNYYYVDVGENYCHVSERNCLISVRDALASKDKNQLKIAREVLVHSFKERSHLSQDGEFKMVLVNKLGKMLIESYVEDIETKVTYEPFVSCKEYDAFIVFPKQELTIKCEVVPYETEYRNLPYDDIKPPKNKRRNREYYF